MSLPIVDVAPLVARNGNRARAGAEIDAACREYGFFYIVGHGVDAGLQARLAVLSRDFFAQDAATKLEIRMALAGRAWRGYFPVGDELTSGKPDRKEGLYFGAELDDDHPKVRAGTRLFGRNLWPPIPGFRETVLAYMDAMTQLGHSLMEGLSLGLGLPPNYFHDRYTAEPFTLFRIFNYPATLAKSTDGEWGAGEHTDYGVLTILLQDETPGLMVKSPAGWIEAPPLANSFVCNIGDMLERLTRGRYRSTPHRVRNRADRDRLSFPFFFDPNFDAPVAPLEGVEPGEARGAPRWDGANVHDFSGTYGDYVLAKVAKVFPELTKS